MKLKSNLTDPEKMHTLFCTQQLERTGQVVLIRPNWRGTPPEVKLSRNKNN